MKLKLIPVRELVVTRSRQGYHVGTMAGGKLLTCHLIGYSRADAIRKFREAHPIKA